MKIQSHLGCMDRSHPKFHWPWEEEPVEPSGPVVYLILGYVDEYEAREVYPVAIYATYEAARRHVVDAEAANRSIENMSLLRWSGKQKAARAANPLDPFIHWDDRREYGIYPLPLSAAVPIFNPEAIRQAVDATQNPARESYLSGVHSTVSHEAVPPEPDTTSPVIVTEDSEL